MVTVLVLIAVIVILLVLLLGFRRSAKGRQRRD